MGGNDLAWIGCPIDISDKKCGISGVKHRFELEKLQAPLRSRKPSLNQLQSADGSPADFLNVSTVETFPIMTLRFFETELILAKNWQNVADDELKIWEMFLEIPRFAAPIAIWRRRLKIGIYTDVCARSPFGEDSINWESGVGICRILVKNGESDAFFSLGINGEIPLG